jgi:hypothetical protein
MQTPLRNPSRVLAETGPDAEPLSEFDSLVEYEASIRAQWPECANDSGRVEAKPTSYCDPEMQAAIEAADEEAETNAEIAAEDAALAETEAEDSAVSDQAEEWFPLFPEGWFPKVRFLRALPVVYLDARRRRGPSRAFRSRAGRRCQRSRDRPRPRPRRADPGRLARGRLGVGATL